LFEIVNSPAVITQQLQMSNSRLRLDQRLRDKENRTVGPGTATRWWAPDPLLEAVTAPVAGGWQARLPASEERQEIEARLRRLRCWETPDQRRQVVLPREIRAA
jgi:hypothetical protein